MISEDSSNCSIQNREETITEVKSDSFEIEIIPDKEIKIRWNGILIRRLFIPRNNNAIEGRMTKA
jgi:hypothetical protein